MADFLTTSLTGLAAFQKALATTSHNIANVNTEGFSRQRVNLAAVPGPLIDNVMIGQGVEVSSVTRVLDQFQVDQVRTDVAEQQRLDAFAQLSSRLDRLLASPETGISAPMQELFSALQAVADSPSSIPARQVALSQASVLADRIHTLDGRLETQEMEIQSRLGASVEKVNALAESVASLNTAIFEAGASSGGNPPNDLLDQRDLVLRELSELVSIEVVTQNDGSTSVFIGEGQPLVLGNQANQIALVNGDFGTTSPELTFIGATGVSTLRVNGGDIGGLMDFRREMLEPSRNVLGQLAVALTETFNAQHREGMDLEGNLGGDFFAIGGPQVIANVQNSGGGDIGVTVADPGVLTSGDYLLAFDGASYALTRTDSGATVAMSGSGSVADPFVADGLSIVVNAVPAVGDEFLIRPTHAAAAGFGVVLSNPEKLAAALPVRASAAVTNSGDGRIFGEEVLDAGDPNLLNSVTIEFVDSSTYTINGAGSFAYSQGSPIEVNGWRVRIDGAPAAGDQFILTSNSGGVGDNRNALELAGSLDRGVLSNGTTSVRDGYGNLVSQISSVTRRAEVNLTAQTAITDQAIADQLSVSGVNLDEEAANMVRYQQAYQAAAQLIGVADVLFQTMLAAVRR